MKNQIEATISEEGKVCISSKTCIGRNKMVSEFIFYSHLIQIILIIEKYFCQSIVHKITFITFGDNETDNDVNKIIEITKKTKIEIFQTVSV